MWISSTTNFKINLYSTINYDHFAVDCQYLISLIDNDFSLSVPLTITTRIKTKKMLTLLMKMWFIMEVYFSSITMLLRHLSLIP